jgi:hypothetical protein
VVLFLGLSFYSIDLHVFFVLVPCFFLYYDFVVYFDFGMVILPAVFSLHKFALAISDLLCFHMNYKIDFSTQNLKLDLLYDLASQLLSIYTNECKSKYNRDTCIAMFIEALFILAKLYSQPTSPKNNEQIKRICYIYTKW